MKTNEDLNKKSDSTVGYRQIALAVTVGTTNLVNSMAMGFSSPAIVLLRQDPSMKVSEEEASWIASIMPAGAILGSLVSSYLVDKYGRRNLLIWSMLTFLGSWLVIAMSYDINMIILARFMGGICVGVTSSAGSVYLAETIQESYRPSQGIIISLFGTSGMFLMALLLMALSWRGLAWAGVATSFVPLASLVFLPESPFHLNKFSAEKSLQSLTWLLGAKKEAKIKFREMNIAQNFDFEKSQIGFSFSNSINAYPILVLITLHVIQQFTGINTFIFFSATLFSKVGGKDFGESCAMIMTAINVVSSVGASLFQGYQKRKLLLKLSTWTIVPCLWIISLFFMLQDSKRFGTEFSFQMNLVPVVAIMLYIVSFSVGWGPVPFLFMGEGLPWSVRGNATGMAMALNWGSAFLVTKSFFWLSGYIGYGWVFIVYSMFTTAGGLLMEIYMPETLGKSITEMDTYYINLRKEAQD